MFKAQVHRTQCLPGLISSKSLGEEGMVVENVATFLSSRSDRMKSFLISDEIREFLFWFAREEAVEHVIKDSCADTDESHLWRDPLNCFPATGLA